MAISVDSAPGKAGSSGNPGTGGTGWSAPAGSSVSKVSNELKQSQMQAGGQTQSTQRSAPPQGDAQKGHSPRKDGGDIGNKESSSSKKGPGSPSPKRTLLMILGGALLLVILGIALYFVLLNPYSAPSEIRVTNVTDRSATISWVTSRATPGVVVYGEEDSFPPVFSGINSNKAYDDRDVSAAHLEAADDVVAEGGDTSAEMMAAEEVKVTKKGKYYVHHVTLTDLSPQNTYHFRVGNGVIFSISDSDFADDQFTAVTTGTFMTYKELDELMVPSPTYGNVISDVDVVSDGVAFMKPRPGSNITPLSGVLNEYGRWYIDLSSARTTSGDIVTDFNEDTDVEEVLVEGGKYGRSEVERVPMSGDAPAEDINLNEAEVSLGGAEVSGLPASASQDTGLVSRAHAAPASCPESNPCTVSPVNIRSIDNGNASGYEALDEDADFGSLQEALDWAEEMGGESWFLLLSGGRFSVENEPKHVWSAGEVNNGNPGVTETPITADVHLIGELVEDVRSMPEIVSYVENVNPPTTPPPRWPEGVPYTPPKQIFGIAPRVIFEGVSSASVENIYFGRGASRGNYISMTKSEAEDVTNIYSTVKAMSSAVDIKNCRFESHRNHDIVEKAIPTSQADIEYYRVTAVRMEDSSGMVSGNIVTGSWAGGVYATGSSSDVKIHNNQIDAEWFMVWADGGSAEIYGNAFWTIDGRLWNECYKTNPAASAAPLCQQMFQAFPNGVPLWDWPVYGVYASGLTLLNMQQNTVDGPDTLLYMKDVSGGRVSKNLFIRGKVGRITSTGSTGVVVSDNYEITYAQKMESEIDMNACYQSTGTGFAMAGGRVAGRTAHLLCLVWPKAGSQVEAKRVGASFATGWDSVLMLHGERGCATLPMDCASVGTMVCDETQNACLRPGEESPGQTTVPAGCSIEDPASCVPDGNGKGNQEPPPGAGGGSATAGGSGWSPGDNPTDIPVTPPNGPNSGLLDGLGDVLAAIVNPVRAQTSTYTVTDDYVLIPKEDGVYDIVIPDQGEAKEVLLLEGEEYRFFVDENENGVLDEGEEIIEIEGLSVDLVVNEELEVARRDVKAGLNFVSFEYLPEDVDSCKLLELLDQTSENGVTQLARFESGLFEGASYRRETGEPAAGSCFPVVPGRGYVLRSVSDDEIAFSGYRLAESAGVAFDSPGWHLIGVNGSAKVYTAGTLIDSIDEVEDLDADNVTQWDSSKYRYEGLAKEEDDQGQMQVYGFDFPIEGNTSYFVRIVEGSGVWTPDAGREL